ncbi:MAG: hypothetical protein OXE77_03405 [Flavobacteriaceae bacterium]|nr:hypothetical protein [Flavobacteriaceae bacterium]MCY4266364.1 hypothetical protein [Flavobacteriaceae bacterium]
MIFVYDTSFSLNSYLSIARPIIASPPLKGEPKKITQDHKEGQRENQELQAQKNDHEEQLEDSPNADHEARWFKKRKKSMMGTNSILP